MNRLYHVTLWLVIGVSALVTGWGLASDDIKAVLIGMVIALAVWVIEDDF